MNHLAQIAQSHKIMSTDALKEIALLTSNILMRHLFQLINSIFLCCPLQIGRSTESPIDFVVTDTSGGKEGEDPSIAPSTISRFACRIVCERNPPYTARIYAAGFDSSKNIFLGVSRLILQQQVSNNRIFSILSY